MSNLSVKYAAYFDFWQDQLRRWPKATVESLQIPVSSQEFLFEVGLPSGIDWNVRFLAPDVEKVQGRPDFVVIGYDAVAPICIIERSGAVICLQDGKARFMNTLVEQLAACLTVFQQYRLEVRGIPDEDEEAIDRLIKRTEKRVREADARAMDPGAWFWPLVLEQLLEGLL